MEFRKIETNEEIDALVSVAKEIWTEHFGKIFDSEILPRLIEGAQSKRVILSQIDEGYQYFFIIENDTTLGYFAYNIDVEKDELFLSKLYIYFPQRGKGVGRKVLKHLEDVCKEAKVKKISLTVYHENNATIKAYEKWGFRNIGSFQRRFDTGLICKDIIMEYVVL